MTQSRLCDKCGQPISEWDEKLQDEIDRTYPNRDICPNCDQEIQIGKAANEQAVVEGVPVGVVLARWLSLYS